MFEKRCFENPLLSQEPKRETSTKKQNKFMKLFHRCFDIYINDPRKVFHLYKEHLINDTNIKEIIEYLSLIHI